MAGAVFMEAKKVLLRAVTAFTADMSIILDLNSWHTPLAHSCPLDIYWA
jgi:hypothetical protein